MTVGELVILCLVLGGCMLIAMALGVLIEQDVRELLRRRREGGRR